MATHEPIVSGYQQPILTVDVALLTLRNGQLMAALIPRTGAPFEGAPALVGGYVHVDEDRDADATVERVLANKAGLKNVYAEQLRTFSGQARDPRGWSASVAYVALLPADRLAKGAPTLLLVPADDPGDLPFDHELIIAAARDRLRTKGAYSTLPARLLPPTFTLPEMQQVYETVTGERLDQSSFRRKIAELGAVEPVIGETRRSSTVRRPAQLYRLAEPIALFDRKL